MYVAALLIPSAAELHGRWFACLKGFLFALLCFAWLRWWLGEEELCTPGSHSHQPGRQRLLGWSQRLLCVFHSQTTFWVASFPHALKKTKPKQQQNQNDHHPKKSFRTGKIRTSEWITYVFFCGSKLRYKMVFCVHPAVVIFFHA